MQTAHSQHTNAPCKQQGNDPIRFLTYVVTTLQIIEADLGAGVLILLQSSQLRSTESIPTSLINEAAEATQDFIFFLDDYHVIQIQPIHDALTHLVPMLYTGCNCAASVTAV